MAFELNNKQYYKAEYVKEINNDFFYGTARSIRMIVTKKNIPLEHYAFGTYSKREYKWTLSDEKINKASLLLTKEWVEQNVPEWEKDGVVTNQQKLILENAPPLLQLKDEEKIKDENGNIVEIETRGTKTIDDIYFYGKDIERILKLNNINDTLLSDKSTYKINIHYFKYIRTDSLTDGINTIKREVIFLTYYGLVKMLMTTRKHVELYITEWLSKLMEIPITHVRFISAETDTIEAIRSTLSVETITQYSVGKYRIDLFIPKYNIGIECDEHEHKSYDNEYELNRENEIKNITKCTFIRYDPYSNNFNIFKLIKTINDKIYSIDNENNNFEIKYMQLMHKHECEKQQKELENKEQNIIYIKTLLESELRELNIKHEIDLREKEYEIKEKEHENRELELKLQHERELKNIEKQFKEHLLSLQSIHKQH